MIPSCTKDWVASAGAAPTPAAAAADDDDDDDDDDDAYVVEVDLAQFAIGDDDGKDKSEKEKLEDLSEKDGSKITKVFMATHNICYGAWVSYFVGILFFPPTVSPGLVGRFGCCLWCHCNLHGRVGYCGDSIFKRLHPLWEEHSENAYPYWEQ